MMKMNGKTNIKSDSSKITFKDLYIQQSLNQQKMLKMGNYDNFKSEETAIVPCDDVKLFSYHMQQLTSELGEVLQSDKRWKNMRNIEFDKSNKVEEIADCFIVLMNVAMFSGVDSDDMVNSILNKLDIISERIAEHNKK